MTYEIVILPTAEAALKAISDRRVLKKIGDRIDQLATDPDLQGKPLGDELVGFRSARAVGQRYRIVYKVDGDRVLVFVAVVGLRKEGDKKDVYRMAAKFWRMGLLEIPEEAD
jgi:mRNA interferase RelE/StbE